MDYKAICEVLYKLRAINNKTIKCVADELYVSKKWVWNRENNIYSLKVTDLLEMLNYYNVTIDEFIEMVREEMEKND